MLLALGYYGRELSRLRWVSLPALLLPALGDICLLYLAPLIVAQLAGRLAGGADPRVATVLPYVRGFVGLMLLAEVLWRAGVHCLNRTDGRGIENLYVVGMNELLAKDAAFFHDNFAGSLTKRVLSFAARFEDFADTLAFSVVANILPLAFASVILWRYDPLLVVVLLCSSWSLGWSSRCLSVAARPARSFQRKKMIRCVPAGQRVVWLVGVRGSSVPSFAGWRMTGRWSWPRGM